MFQLIQRVSEEIIFITVKELDPATSCVTDQDVTIAPIRQV